MESNQSVFNTWYKSHKPLHKYRQKVQNLISSHNFNGFQKGGGFESILGKVDNAGKQQHLLCFLSLPINKISDRSKLNASVDDK